MTISFFVANWCRFVSPSYDCSTYYFATDCRSHYFTPKMCRLSKNENFPLQTLGCHTNRSLGVSTWWLFWFAKHQHTTMHWTTIKTQKFAQMKFRSQSLYLVHRTKPNWNGKCDFKARESNHMICVCSNELFAYMHSERTSNWRWVRFMPFVLSSSSISNRYSVNSKYTEWFYIYSVGKFRFSIVQFWILLHFMNI